MKSNYMNYFKDRTLYQWDKNKDIFTITPISVEDEFCLDQKGMDMFLKFYSPNSVLPDMKLGNTLQMKKGKLKSSIKLHNESLIMPDMDFTSVFKMDVDKLKVANKFVATSLSKPILTGVNVSNNSIAATDSYTAYKSECTNDCNITITSSFVDILTSFKGEIEIKCNSNTIACEVDGTTYIGRLLAGAYPNLDRLYATKPSNYVEINKQELKQLLSYASGKNNYVTLEKDKLTIDGDNEFVADIELPLECSICVTLEKLSLVVNSVEDETIRINYSDGSHPVFVNDEYLILPIKRG